MGVGVTVGFGVGLGVGVGVGSGSKKRMPNKVKACVVVGTTAAPKLRVSAISREAIILVIVIVLLKIHIVGQSRLVAYTHVV